MDRLGLLNTLLVALDAGSLSRAAQRLNVSQSAVSQQIRALEHCLNQQLLLRTATGVQATRAGATAAQHARQLLAAYEVMKHDLEEQSERLAGTYRISAGTVLGRAVLGPLLLQLNQAHPDLNIIMRMEDRYVDVVRENYDLAIRAGNLGDSDGYGRKIAELDTVLVASPALLNRQGRPQTPDDLRHLKFIRYNEELSDNILRLHRGKLTVDVPLDVGFTAGDSELILQALLAGVGYTRTVRMLVADQLADGSLKELLPSYRPCPKHVFAVYPSPKRLDICQHAIIDGFVECIAAQKTQPANTSNPLQLITA